MAETEGVAVGTASGGDGETTGVAALTAMWVDPRYRRQGVGGLLVQRVVDWAQQAGYEEIFLWVVRGNEAAVKLYERNGFGRTGAQQEVRPGQLEDEMSRRLR